MEPKQRTTSPWWIVVAVAAGPFLSAQDATIVSVTLSKIKVAFDTDVSLIIWVLNTYLIASTVPMIPLGRIGDIFGRKRMYILGLIVFIVSAAFCGLAWSVEVLLAFRVIQGISAAAIVPLSMSIITEAFPAEKRGLALGLASAMPALGAVLGPPLGGVLADTLGWRWIFFIDIPIGVVGLIVATIILYESKDSTASRSMDYAGLLTLTLGVLCLNLFLIQGEEQSWTSYYILLLAVVAVLSLVGFTFVERRASTPLVDLSLFRNATYSIANVASFILFLVMMGIIFLVPLNLQTVLNYSATKAGLVLLIYSLANLPVAPAGGKLADKVGNKIPAAIGLSLGVVSLFLFSRVTSNSTFPYLMLSSIIGGLGIGLAIPPIANAAMGAIPKEKVGVGSGVFNLIWHVGGIFGVALLGAILQIRTASHGAETGFNNAFLVGAIICFIGVISALIIGKPSKNEIE